MKTYRLAAVVGLSLAATGCANMYPPRQPITSSPPVTAPVSSATNPEVLNALNDVQALQSEVRELRDLVERQEFELQKLTTRQSDLYDDLDRRLRTQERSEMASGAVAPAGSNLSSPNYSNVQGVTVPPGGTGLSSGTLSPVTSTATLGGSSGQVVAPSTTVPTVGSLPATTAGQQGIQSQSTASLPQTGGAVSGSAQDAYDQAFSLLKQSRYADAVQAFELFIRDYPNNDLTDDAYYWLAEARYVTRDFEAALNGFRNVTTRFPNSQRVPASYLKIGYIQYEIGAYVDARETLTYILKNFPTHRVAVSAETRLKKMDREGR